VSRLPPVVEAARHVSNVGRGEWKGSITEGFESAAGPHNPKVLWKAEFSDLGAFVGLAGDGTLYFEGSGGVYAIRDGKQQWGFKLVGDGPHFATDGRLWMKQQIRLADHPGDDDYRFAVYNSHGEGGVTAAKSEPEQFVTYSNIWAPGWGSGGTFGWTIRLKMFAYKNCGLGELLGKYDDPGDKSWRVNVDGDCGALAVNDDGDLLTVTDKGTLYCVSPLGRIRWTTKVACQPDHLIAWGSSNTVYVCANTLHAVHGSEPRWELKLERAANYSAVKADKANTLYLLTPQPISLLAIDDTGKLLWQRPFDRVTLLGLDNSGRLYMQSASTLMCLSD
jgi:PQQ-like domain